MFVKLLLLVTICISVFHEARTNKLTFKNVIVTCENENISENDDTIFVTTITASSIKNHLPKNGNCYKLEIQHSNIPILHRNSLSNINANFLLLESDYIQLIEPGAFKNLSIQEGMSLNSNRLTEIRKGVFNHVKVPILYLSMNLISRIDPEAFDNMPTLESIHLDNNKLLYIDSNWFKNTPNLNKLNLQKNFIQDVPPNAFKNLAVEKYKSAPQIDLSKNRIIWVSKDAFRIPGKFRYLTLADNKLVGLDETWLKDVEINILDISNNRLECLTSGLASKFSTNYIDGNPWRCNCLQKIKNKENSIFGHIVAEEELKRCNI